VVTRASISYLDAVFQATFQFQLILINHAAFLQGAANILGMAIERQRYERSLRQALEHQTVLLHEISHRVKNSLQLVASMFGLQATATQNAELAQGLQDAMGRVTAIARIHERLYRTADISNVDLVPYLADVCLDLAELAPHCEIRYEPDGPIPIATDRAVRIALLMTELVTNAAKHAYPPGQQGRVLVRLTHADQDTVRLSVGDEGPGLPTAFDIERDSSIGIQIVRALITQTGATLSIHQCRLPLAELEPQVHRSTTCHPWKHPVDRCPSHAELPGNLRCAEALLAQPPDLVRLDAGLAALVDAPSPALSAG